MFSAITFHYSRPKRERAPQRTPAIFLRISHLRLISTLALSFVCLLSTSASRAAVLDHAWCTYESDAFQIITDLDRSRAENLQQFLEQFKYAAQFALNMQEDKSPEQVRVIAFNRNRDFRKLTRSRRYIGFMQPSLTGSILVLGASKPSALRDRVAAHEYVHYLTRKNSETFHPMWYEEGLAGYLSTLRVKNNQLIIGEIPANVFLDTSGLNLRQLLNASSQASWSRKATSKFYGQAWMLVHYLKHGPFKQSQIDQLIELLNRGLDVGRALEQSLHLSLRALENALHIYARKVRHPHKRVDFAAPKIEQARQAHCLSQYRSREVLGRAMQAHNPDWSKAVFIRQLKEFPNDLTALTRLSEIYASQGKTEKAAELAQATYDLFPDDASSQIQLANLKANQCLGKRTDICFDELRQAQKYYRNAIRQDPNRIDGVFGLGLTQLFLGRPGEAIKYFQVAYLSAPWAPILNFYLGETHREIGDRVNARLYLSRANNWATLPGIQRLSAHALGLL